MIDRFGTLLLLTVSSAVASQPSAPPPVDAPLRDLIWGQLNFLHTTDIHGWLAGHLQEYVILAHHHVHLPDGQLQVVVLRRLGRLHFLLHAHAGESRSKWSRPSGN